MQQMQQRSATWLREYRKGFTAGMADAADESGDRWDLLFTDAWKRGYAAGDRYYRSLNSKHTAEV